MTTILNSRYKEAMTQEKIWLFGDSIRLGYQKQLSTTFFGKEIVGPKENCGDSSNLYQMIRETSPTGVVVFNAGLHDIRKNFTSDQYQVELSQYKENIQNIINYLKSKKSTFGYFITTIPFNEEVYNRFNRSQHKSYGRFLNDLDTYNNIALDICSQSNTCVIDLNAEFKKLKLSQMRIEDGLHLTEQGYSILGKFILENLAMRY